MTGTSGIGQVEAIVRIGTAGVEEALLAAG